MNLDPSTTVYLDTSAWNALCDWSAHRSKKWLEGPVYLFSSCNLDEFSLAPSARAQELAAFAWRLSDRRKLLDFVEVTAAELASCRSGRPVDYFDSKDRGFALAWAAMRDHGVGAKMREAMQASAGESKDDYMGHLKATRELLSPFFRAAAERGISRDWSDVLLEMEGESDIRGMIASALSEPGLPSRSANLATLANVGYRELPGTACWVQYHLALSFLAAQRTGKLSKPDSGDQADFRHGCYAGIADVFVTRDSRMLEVLTTMVPSCRARVVTPESLLDGAAG